MKGVLRCQLLQFNNTQQFNKTYSYRKKESHTESKVWTHLLMEVVTKCNCLATKVLNTYIQNQFINCQILSNMTYLHYFILALFTTKFYVGSFKALMPTVRNYNVNRQGSK